MNQFTANFVRFPEKFRLSGFSCGKYANFELASHSITL